MVSLVASDGESFYQENSTSEKSTLPQRLLIVSSRSRNISQISNNIQSHVILIQYKYESSGLDSIIGEIMTKLGTKKVGSIAFIMHGDESQLYICAIGEKVLSAQSIVEQLSIREFFRMLVSTYLDVSFPNARVDFLATYFDQQGYGEHIIKELQSLLSVPVGLSKDLVGTESFVLMNNTQIPVGQLYFNTEKFKESRTMVATPRPRYYNKDAYEKIRTVGKGAFGTAVLCRRKSDDLLVVIKEINMHDLIASERQLALNEIKVLAMMSHPNIITYFDSFEDDGILKIEMEYADGGNLAEFLSQRQEALEEREILILFHQIVSAIRHMHDHNILHRDLKTANILLTKEGIIKVGDFGISKMMTTRHKANTVVGTPYYISPEMCEGKMYDEKSDIWALGCILYEMTCLQKTFEGSNLPALVNKIMKGQFAPVKGNYSHGLKQLIRDLLQRDPQFRPTASEIQHDRLPELLAQFSTELGEGVGEEMMNAIQEVQQRQQSGKSVVYEIRTFESSISLTPIPLPPRSQIMQLAVSKTHMIALTNELLVYTWGDGRRGQLGHGLLEMWRVRPECVAALKGKSITKVCAGDGVSVFASNSGIVMTCGDGTSGCLGHDDWNCYSRPKLLEKLLSVDVSAIDCGPNHVVVIGEGDVYSWGRGAGGRLGLGHEDDCCSPCQVTLPPGVNVKKVKCGVDGTMFITDTGKIMACGNNKYNKLGLNETGGFFHNLLTKTDVEKTLTPTLVKSLTSFHAMDISMGPNHTAVLVEPNYIITFGRNSEGQLGRGHTRSSTSPSIMKYMLDKSILMIECGETYTVVGTIENALYLWGTRYIMCAPTRPPTQETRAFTFSYPNSDLNNEVNELKEKLNKVNDAERTDRANSGFSLINETENKQINSPNNYSACPSTKNLYNGSAASKSSTGPRMKDVLLHPEEILALYASPAQISKGETVNLSSIHCEGQNIFVVVDTTAPLPHQGRHRYRPTASNNTSGNNETQQNKDEANNNHLNLNTTPLSDLQGQSPSKDLDTMGPVPDWLKEELQNSDPAWTDNKLISEDNKEIPNRNIASRKNSALPKSFKQTRTAQELKIELERLHKAKIQAESRLEEMNQEFQSKQDKLHQEAEQMVKEREEVLKKEIARLKKELDEQKLSSQSYSRQIQNVQDELQNQSDSEPNKSSLCLIQ